MKVSKTKYIWLGMIPVCFAILLVIKYGVNVLYWDEWEMVNYLSDGVTVQFLISPHNEHILLFPKLIMIFLNWLFDWNSKVQMLFSVFLLVFAYYIILKWLLEREKISVGDKVLSYTIIGFSLFSPIQYFNFLMGFQIAFNLITVMVIFAFYCLYQYYAKGKMQYYVGTILCAIVASFSSLQGLVIWIAILLCSSGVYVLDRKKENLKWLLIQYGVAIVTFFAYFINWSKPTGHPEIGEGGIFNIIKGFLIVVGGICGNKNEIINGVVGIIFLCLLAYLYLKAIIRKELKEKVFGIGVSLFGFGGAGAATLGRIGFGVDTLLASVDRYAPFSILIFVGLLILVLEERRSIWRHFLYIFGTLLIINSLNYLSSWKETAQQRSNCQYIVQNYRDCSLDELKTVYPWNDYQASYNTIYELEKRKINAFNEQCEVIQPPFKIDYATQVPFPEGPFLGFDETTVVFDDRFLSLRYPWAVDFIYGDTYEKVYIKINESLYLPHQDWISRNDVADAFGNPNFKYSGFTFSLPIQELEHGKNTISILVFLRGGTEYYESKRVEFYVSESGGTLRNETP